MSLVRVKSGEVLTSLQIFGFPDRVWILDSGRIWAVLAWSGSDFSFYGVHTDAQAFTGRSGAEVNLLNEIVPAAGGSLPRLPV
jgi:hypothetical protein